MDNIHWRELMTDVHGRHGGAVVSLNLSVASACALVSAWLLSRYPRPGAIRV